MRKILLGGFATLALGCVQGATDTASEAVDVQALHDQEGAHLRNNTPIPNPSGFGATVNLNDDDIDLNGGFFTSFGTNGRVCGTCHEPTDGWTVVPSHIQARFEATGGTDPIFRTNDGTVSPDADVSTVDARRQAYRMLLTKGLIRVGIGVPDGAQFELAAVDDPYGHANATDLSLFRRPLPAANLNFLSTVMWDGRETFVDSHSPALADSNCFHAPFPDKCFRSLEYDLEDQALGATLGHAQAMVPGLTPAQQTEIATFERGLIFAQVIDRRAGELDSHGATGGTAALAGQSPYFGLNDNFGDYATGAAFSPVIFSDYDAWADSDHHGHMHDRDRDSREAIARGQAIFNSRSFTISGVGGLNGLKDRNGNTVLPASFGGTCGTCHDATEGGNHTVPAPLNIGIADGSRRTPDMPLYTLRCSAAGVAAHACNAGDKVETTDPGRALITGQWADIGKFKGPTLRGLAARAPYFHNGSAADLDAVVDFYNDRFNMGLSDQEHDDLVAFLKSL